MSSGLFPRFEHLRRLTDSQGLLHTARGDCPDRFSGYEAIDNAEALRLCALGSETVEAEVSHWLARTHFGFLSRGRRYDSGVRHECDSTGGWTCRGDDALVQSYLARALSAVIVSELPITLRLSAADWWRMLLEEHGHAVYVPLAAANWLIAIGRLRAADPGRDLDRAETFAHWLIEDLYYANRASDWEWCESAWSQRSAVVATGLWHAYHLLGERRILRVAEALTQFVLDRLFNDSMVVPAGTLGTWARGGSKPPYDQTPEEVTSIIELLCAAEQVSGNAAYGDWAELACQWFEGANTRQLPMIDAASGGCHNALTAAGVDPNQGASAMLACLHAYAAIATRPIQIEEPAIPLIVPFVLESLDLVAPQSESNKRAG